MFDKNIKIQRNYYMKTLITIIIFIFVVTQLLSLCSKLFSQLITNKMSMMFAFKLNNCSHYQLQIKKSCDIFIDAKNIFKFQQISQELERKTLTWSYLNYDAEISTFFSSHVNFNQRLNKKIKTFFELRVFKNKQRTCLMLLTVCVASKLCYYVFFLSLDVIAPTHKNLSWGENKNK